MFAGRQYRIPAKIQAKHAWRAFWDWQTVKTDNGRETEHKPPLGHASDIDAIKFFGQLQP